MAGGLRGMALGDSSWLRGEPGGGGGVWTARPGGGGPPVGGVGG